MTNRILLAGLLAGIIAGLISSALQHVFAVPLILSAETFETPGDSGHAHEGAAGHGQENGSGHDHAAPSDGMAGLKRIVLTTLASVGGAVAFAFILLGLMAMTGSPITWRTGLIWGGCFFAAFHLAPALGIPPELPGMQSADLRWRQIWWIGTAAATLGGLWLVLRTATPIAIVAGLALIALPHGVGAPQALSHAGEVPASEVPATIAASFVGVSIALAAVTWLMVGSFAGLIWGRIGKGA
jgi:cobalt transporter subunit CbtA